MKLPGQSTGIGQPASRGAAFAGLLAPFRLLVGERTLYMRMVARDVSARYKGAVLGLLWVLMNPLILLAVFGFVFGIVFEAKWGGRGERNFSLLLFSGLSVFLLASECLNRAPLLVVQHASYVKKVVFPLELLPPIVVGAALINFAIAMVVLLIAQLVMTGGLPVTWFLLPIVLAPLLLMLAGFVYFVAALGVFLRDLLQVMGLVTLVLMYLSPVLFPMEAVPEPYRDLLVLNPITIPVNQLRAVTLLGEMPDWRVFSCYSAAAYFVLLLGYGFFTRCRRGFADVL